MSEENYSSMMREVRRRALNHETFVPLNKRQPSFWEKHNEAVGMFLWILAVAMICAMSWLALDACMAPFR